MKESLRPWEELPLEALLKEPLANGRSVPDGTGFRVLRLTALRNGAFNFSESKRGNWSAEDATRFLVAHGDVFVVRGNGSISLVGRAGFVKIAPPPVAFPDTMIRVRVRSDRILPQFLAVQLEAPRMREQIERAAKTTAGIFKVNQGDLHLLRLVVPPLLDQAHIVSVIETQFSRLDVAIASLERAKANIKRARASVLKAAVEGRLVPNEAALARSEGRDYEPASALLARILADRRTRWAESDGKGKYKEPVTADLDNVGQLPLGWAWGSCDQAGEILLGRRRAPEYTGAEQLYLRVANVKDGLLQLDDVQRMPFEDAEFEKYRLLPGDVLVSEGQSPELVGQSALYSGLPNPCAFQATLHRFRPDPASILPRYAETVFRAWVRGGVFRRRCIVTTNIGHLTLGRFKSVPFPLPPLAEQRRIVTEVDRRLSVLDAIEVTVNADLARCASLRQSILKRAFEGRLVPPETATTDKPLSPLSLQDAAR